MEKKKDLVFDMAVFEPAEIMFAYGMIMAMVGALTYYESGYKSLSPIIVCNLIMVVSVSIASVTRDLTIPKGASGYKAMMVGIHAAIVLPILFAAVKKRIFASPCSLSLFLSLSRKKRERETERESELGKIPSTVPFRTHRSFCCSSCRLSVVSSVRIAHRLETVQDHRRCAKSVSDQVLRI